MNTVKKVDKYRKMMTSSVTLTFLKSYYIDIKNICKENQEDFKQARVIYSSVFLTFFRHFKT